MGMVIQFNDYDRKSGEPDCLEDRYINGFQRILKLWDGRISDKRFPNASEIRALSTKMIDLLEDAKKNPQMSALTQAVAENAILAIDTYTIGMCAINPALIHCLGSGTDCHQHAVHLFGNSAVQRRHKNVKKDSQSMT